MKFNDILNKYIDLIECSSKDIAKYSNLSESIISRYKSGNRVPNSENLKKISEALSILSNRKYKTEEIFNEFNSCINDIEFDFDIIRCNLNKLIVCLDINASKLAKFLNFDASYLSRIRNGNRVPSNKQEFVDGLTNYIVKKYSTKKYLITSLEIIIILLVGISRIYLGVHYFTDIIGAILISIAIILIANDLEIFEKYINRGNKNDNKIRRNNIK